ncbi:MAG: hypothetical protein KR126chlam1_00598 [Chlamydiae bacterium]|nr:hypothetical protein [Chlamydiota bacterium]
MTQVTAPSPQPKFQYGIYPTAAWLVDQGFATTSKVASYCPRPLAAKISSLFHLCKPSFLDKPVTEIAGVGSLKAATVDLTRWWGDLPPRNHHWAFSPLYLLYHQSIGLAQKAHAAMAPLPPAQMHFQKKVEALINNTFTEPTDEANNAILKLQVKPLLESLSVTTPTKTGEFLKTIGKGALKTYVALSIHNWAFMNFSKVPFLAAKIISPLTVLPLIGPWIEYAESPCQVLGSSSEFLFHSVPYISTAARIYTYLLLYNTFSSIQTKLANGTASGSSMETVKLGEECIDSIVASARKVFKESDKNEEIFTLFQSKLEQIKYPENAPSSFAGQNPQGHGISKANIYRVYGYFLGLIRSIPSSFPGPGTLFNSCMSRIVGGTPPATTPPASPRTPTTPPPASSAPGSSSASSSLLPQSLMPNSPGKEKESLSFWGKAFNTKRGEFNKKYPGGISKGTFENQDERIKAHTQWIDIWQVGIYWADARADSKQLKECHDSQTYQDAVGGMLKALQEYEKFLSDINQKIPQEITTQITKYQKEITEFPELKGNQPAKGRAGPSRE